MSARKNRSVWRKHRIIYARVSSRQQTEDLKRQIHFMKQRFRGYTVFQDVSSGLCTERPQFKKMMDLILDGQVEDIACYSKDRMARFGTDFIEWLCRQNGTKLSFALQAHENPDIDLIQEFLGVIHGYNCKLHGSRRYN